MIATYAKLLEDFSDEALELAANTILKTPKLRAIPAPGDCIEACREATTTLELRARREQTKRKPIPPQVMWTEEDAKRADELFASHWGRRAVDDGVEVALWDFLVQHKCWPNNIEYGALKATSLAVQADLKDTFRAMRENGGLPSNIRTLIKMMKTKSDELKAMV
jgi:hypothetical protein